MRIHHPVNAAILLPDPCINRVWFPGDLENSGTHLHVFGPIAAIACLSTIGEVDAMIIAVPVVIMIMSTHYPLDHFLFFECSIETSIDRGATH